jgi:hypothetical protein
MITNTGDNVQREFVMMPEFDKQWRKMGLDEQDLKRLQEQLLLKPTAGEVISGTGGLRKIRFPFEGQGKSGSVRVVYVDFAVYEIIYLIFAYPKSKKDSLTKDEKNNIKKMIEHIEKSLNRRY